MPLFLVLAVCSPPLSVCLFQIRPYPFFNHVSPTTVLLLHPSLPVAFFTILIPTPIPLVCSESPPTSFSLLSPHPCIPCWPHRNPTGPIASPCTLRCSVSWHADSCLEHYSTIAVYHATDPETSPADWKIALRVEPDAEGPAGGRLKLSGRKEVRVQRMRAGRYAVRRAMGQLSCFTALPSGAGSFFVLLSLSLLVLLKVSLSPLEM